MKKITTEKALKLNLIWLVKHHKKHCDGAKCNISLFLVRQLAEKAGIKFTEKEKEVFL